MRLRAALFAYLLALALILSGTVYAGFALHKQDVNDRERERVATTAETVASDIDSRMEERKRTAEFGAATVADGDGNGTQRTLDAFVDRTAFQGVSVIDANGTMQAISAANLSVQQRRQLVGQDFSDRAYVQRAQAGSTYLSDPVEADSGNLIVTISTPIYEDGVVVGTFNAALHVRNASLFAPSTASLGQRQRVIVSANGRTFHADGRVPSDPIVANATVHSTGWRVTVASDRATLQDQLLFATAAQAGAVLIVLLSVALVGLLVSRTVVASIDELIDGLRALADGDYDRELDVDGTDEWVRISESFNDLSTTLDRRESQLQVLDRVLRHNLRNDMSVVIAQADTILHSDCDGEVQTSAQTMRQTAQRLVETSDHARTIHRDILGGRDRAARPVDLSPLVDDVADRLHAEFPASSVRTSVPDLQVKGRDALPIVVEELCRNALLHNDGLPADRKVTVSAEATTTGCRLTVSDNGPGLPDVERELLTRERQETAIEHGNGLGLWVVRWLVDQIGGDVTVSSAPDHGAEITLFLPTPEE
jgi:signal transduction histidine kinase